MAALCILWLLSSCIETFEPALTPAAINFLVVDGSINTQGVTTIRLSRAVALDKVGNMLVESKARVYIEEEGGQQYPLTEGPAGTYTSAALSLGNTSRVRLHLTTAAQKEYVSEFTQAIITPAIESVTWKATAEGLQIAVNAQDETDNLKFYQWEYVETWEFNSAFVSKLEYKNGKIQERTNNISHCWGNEASTSIRLGTTEKLAQNVVSEAPITLLPRNTPKLQLKYSILVKQSALSREEYNYLDILRKNSQNIGSLYDPLPSQLTGNVQCISDKEEVVIGFVGAHSVAEKRLFIDRKELPDTWPRANGYETCILDTIPRPNDPPSDWPELPEIQGFFSPGFSIPVDVFELPTSSGPKSFYLYSSAECVDCRKRGVTEKPTFWP
ncbi:DUF4249 domain-containing protein [Hymenobacter sp. J193]|uniref:DUF4249 domain-containing protein n=1 Tax=Hymenobacter sp. J193 TaxID=2898429 RepID=UPI002151591D|nr:DUF4249 domain-containing protein [Hymenobacter sp. J193]